ncbi:hypothetical protein [Chelatococcus sp.]|uniref:hypothetical protein n=1 Tax=Chelatococcus sp. TaxID=1953771 RepID=UPI0025C55A63|nr:hypothetical protein [Chelatococcus sp.]MBX3559206.1 hypothetical protein [Chelatococcus sp.]
MNTEALEVRLQTTVTAYTVGAHVYVQCGSTAEIGRGKTEQEACMDLLRKMGLEP